MDGSDDCSAQRIEYTEEDQIRWQKEFNENVGKSTHWPSTKKIDYWAGAFRFATVFHTLPLTSFLRRA
jgi:hypothetical protein